MNKQYTYKQKYTYKQTPTLEESKEKKRGENQISRGVRHNQSSSWPRIIRLQATNVVFYALKTKK